MSKYCSGCKCKECKNPNCDNCCEYCEDGDKWVKSCKSFIDGRVLPEGLKFDVHGDIVEE